MKTENKYYTPEIEEFHIGFEFEYINKKEPFIYEIYSFLAEENEWVKRKLSLFLSLDYINVLLKKEYIRIKYLDREDIESLGWEFKEIEEGMLSDIPIFQFKTYLLNFYKNDYGIWIYITDEYVDYSHFSGQVKNKSELLKLMNMLNIK